MRLKRALAILLCLVLALGVLPVTALADDAAGYFAAQNGR